MTEESTIEKNESSVRETENENFNWEKSHPLTKSQNRALQILFGIVLLILAVVLFFGFTEMFEAQSAIR